jgi:hypothetical protein
MSADPSPYDNSGQRFATDHYNEVRAKLTKKFGPDGVHPSTRPRAFRTAAAR